MLYISILVAAIFVGCAPSETPATKGQLLPNRDVTEGQIIDEFPFAERNSFAFAAIREGNPYWVRQNGANRRVRISYAYAYTQNDPQQRSLLDGRLGGVPVAQIKSLTESAFAKWTPYVPLHFVEVDPQIETPDIELMKAPMSGNVRGLGSFVTITMRSDIGWSNSTFESVMAHEVGHAIGMMHSTVAALMSPGGGSITGDDINGVRSIYGQGAGGVYPLAVHNGNVGLWLELQTETADSLQFRWNAIGSRLSPEDVRADRGTYYAIEARKDGESAYNTIGIVTRNQEPQFTVRNLVANAGYRFRIGYPVAGRLIYSNEIAKVMPAGSVSQPPRNIGVANPDIDRRLILPESIAYTNWIAWIDQNASGSVLYYRDLNSSGAMPVELYRTTPEEMLVQVTIDRTSRDIGGSELQNIITASSQSKNGGKIYVFAPKRGLTRAELIWSKDLQLPISLVSVANLNAKLALSWIEYGATTSTLKTVSIKDDAKIVSPVKTILQGSLVNLSSRAQFGCSDRPEDKVYPASATNICHYLLVTQINGNDSVLKLIYEIEKGSQNYASKDVAYSANQTIMSQLDPFNQQQAIFISKNIRGVEVLQHCVFSLKNLDPICNMFSSLDAGALFYVPLQSDGNRQILKFTENLLVRFDPNSGTGGWKMGETIAIPPGIRANQFAVGFRSYAHLVGTSSSGTINSCKKNKFTGVWACASQPRPTGAVLIGAPKILENGRADKLITPYTTGTGQLMLEVTGL